MNLLISIIIPCYNSERFIAPTVEMLIRQNISDCELILVNDGSKDNTLSILQQYEATYENIRVIYQPNQGVLPAIMVCLQHEVSISIFWIAMIH